MRLEDQDAVKFLAGENSVRDGYLVSFSIRDVEWQSVVNLVFHVPRGTAGNLYRLELRGDVEFGYYFSSEYASEQIPMVKCLWTDDGHFYLSLDPWKESEAFISEQDNDCFKSKSVTLTVERTESPA
jgi:hypothetical protein